VVVDFNGIVNEFAAVQRRVTETVAPARHNLTYREWTVELNWLGEWEGTGPNYDCDYNDEVGFVGNGEMVTAKTLEDLRDEIDAYIEEHGA
jgi:hypothetical protein